MENGGQIGDVELDWGILRVFEFLIFELCELNLMRNIGGV